MIRSVVFALVSLVAIQAVNAQQFTTPVRVNHDKSLTSQRSPMMKIGRNGNVYIAWVNAGVSSSGPILMSVSSDGGSNFGGDVTVCADAACNADFQRTAQFVLDTKDNIHMIWMGNRVKSPTNKQLQPDIWYVRSTNNGMTWTAPVSISGDDDSSIYAQDFPSIACDSNDNLYVTFLDSRETQRKQNANVHLYFTKSMNGGTSWSASRRVENFTAAGGTCECCTESIASSSDGKLYVVFRSNISDLRDIWLLRSTDQGANWATPLQVQNGDWHISECPVSGPNIALDDDETAHVVWRDVRDDSAGMAHTYYAAIPKGSTMIPDNTAFDAAGATTVNYPSIALYDHSKYRVITYQTFNYGMRYILYADGKMTVPNRPIPTGTSQQFGTVLFAADGTRYISWQDAKADAGDIYFCEEISPLSTASVEESTPGKPFSVRPNPVSGSQKIITIESEAKSGTFRLVDLKGNTVKLWKVKATGGGMKVDLTGFAAGYYVCVFEHDGRTESNNLEIR
jgi:hypothetical protein